MPATYVETIRNKLRAITGTSKVSDIDEWAKALAEDVDTKMASWWEDTFAKRPAAGQNNRLFRATDTGTIYHDNGATFDPIYSPAATYGALTNRNASTAVKPSASQRVLVTLVIACVGACSGKILVGGRELPFLTGANTTLLVPIIVAQGAEWSWVKESGAIIVQSSDTAL